MDKRRSYSQRGGVALGISALRGHAVQPRDCGPDVCLHPVPNLNAG